MCALVGQCVCMCMCMSVCLYVLYILYVYIYTHTHTRTIVYVGSCVCMSIHERGACVRKSWSRAKEEEGRRRRIYSFSTILERVHERCAPAPRARGGGGGGEGEEGGGGGRVGRDRAMPAEETTRSVDKQ